MKNRVSFLPLSAVVLLSAGLLFSANEAATLENVVYFGPNRADEPFIKEFSFSAAVRFMDSAALTWQKEHKCFACHSNYAFLLARPAISHEVPAHTQIRSILEQRVDNPRTKKPGPYRNSERVMVAAVLAHNDAATTGKLHAQTRKALDRMWTVQREDGGWTWQKKRNRPPSGIDDYYGAAMAAIGAGVAPGNYSETPSARKGLEKIRKYFKSNPPVNMHNRAMKMLASLYVDDIMTDAERRDVIKDLFALQKRDGGWGLATLGNWKRSDGEEQDYESSDGYGTGFAVYVLRCAGVPAKDPRIQKAIAWLKTHQRASGRWFTRSMKQDSKHYITHSGTAYAILALAACGQTEALEQTK
ncbi:MAG: prenyltransferase/squalene oxidase repeat-containing protein [Planctomycetota bacterium]|jgi:squalene-hopene/tetraprenyl-beta-curcumene cyclase